MAAIRWERKDLDGASEILTLCQIDGEKGYVVQITSGPDLGDDFIGLYDLDGDKLPLLNQSWEVVESGMTPELLAEIEGNWESGTTTVTRLS